MSKRLRVDAFFTKRNRSPEADSGQHGTSSAVRDEIFQFQLADFEKAETTSPTLHTHLRTLRLTLL